MKSKFYLAFVLAGIAPIVGLAGFYIYTAMNEVPPEAKTPTVINTPVDPKQQLAEVQTIGSAVVNAIKITNTDAATLASSNDATSLQKFISTHTNVSGIAVVNAAGKADRTVPATSSLIDTNYASNPEFSKIISKFKENGNQNYEFYTSRLGYPAFIFAVPLTKGSFAEVVLNIASFFKGLSSNGQYFILDGNSGQYLYHSDSSKLNTTFNPQHEIWLNAVQADLSSKKSGIALNGTTSAAAYGYLGFGTFGVVHLFSQVLSSPAPAAAVKAESSGLSESIITPMSLGFVLALSLLCIGAAIASRSLAAPFRRVVNVILAASQ